MCFGRSLKGDTAVGTSSTYTPPTTTVPSSKPHMTTMRDPPPPAPPSQTPMTYAPPPPPPSEPSPAYHDWTAIPDTALYPPPPTLGHEASPSANASTASFEAGRDFCATTPLAPPRTLSPSSLLSLSTSCLAVRKPASYIGDLTSPTPGTTAFRTTSLCPDTTLLPSLPLYLSSSSLAPNPARQTIYYELHITALLRPSPSDPLPVIALGFAAAPYPPFRLPGWHRASLAVHSDDGRRYVNDGLGGKDFVRPFQAGDTVGVGMRLSAPVEPPSYAAGDGPGERKLQVEVFFTRNGKREGGWDVHEEVDGETEGGAEGLGGERDLYPALGVCGAVEGRVLWRKEDWLYRPEVEGRA